MSGSFVVPQTLDFLRHGVGAPIWRAVTTPESAVAVNAVAALLIVLCLGFVVRRVCLGIVWSRMPRDGAPTDAVDPRRLLRLTPLLAMVSFVSVPQFMGLVTKLTPLLTGLVPVFLSAAVIASLNSKEPEPLGPDDDNYEDDDRRLVSWRLVLAGALAAVGVWERSLGVFCAPLLLAFTWVPFIRRERRVMSVSATWVVGFLASFLLEPLVVSGCPMSALMPQSFPIFGVVIFFFICVIPVALVLKFGESRWTLGGWAVVLLVFATITVTTGRFACESASEKFVRRVLADLGSRKYVLGDGRFDALIDEYKPADVRRVSATSVADKEFIVRLCDDGQPITNKMLTVRQYYDLKDDLFLAALAETGVVLRKDKVDEKTAARTANERQKKLTEAERKRIVEARRKDFEQKAGPLAASLHAMSEGYKDVPESQRASEAAKAQTVIRKAWKQGFSGTKMSNTLLNIDLQKADRKALEADAVEALVVDRNDPVANTVMGALRLEDGKLEDAEHYLRKGVKGGGVLGMVRLAMLLVNTDRSKEAEEWAQKAVKLVPKDWNARQALAAALIENGKYDEAAQELDEIRQLAAADGQLKKTEAFLMGARRRLAECRGKAK